MYCCYIKVTLQREVGWLSAARSTMCPMSPLILPCDAGVQPHSVSIATRHEFWHPLPLICQKWPEAPEARWVPSEQYLRASSGLTEPCSCKYALSVVNCSLLRIKPRRSTIEVDDPEELVRPVPWGAYNTRYR